MAGPCSQPDGDKRRWNELNEIVCDIHYHCDMDKNKRHEFITYRMWLLKRNRLHTGKTVC
jgi:hypothetical protein